MKRHTTKRAIGLLLAATAGSSLALQPRAAHAQSGVEVAAGIVTVIGYVQKAYSAYQAGKDFLDPQPTTADLIQAAVISIENLMVDTASRNMLSSVENALQTWHDAQHSSAPNALLKQFDSQANTVLDQLETFLSPGADVRYYNELGAAYNALLPLWLANHLKGVTWGSTLSRAQLQTDMINRALKGLQLDYDMVASSTITAGMPTNPADTTSTSPL